MKIWSTKAGSAPLFNFELGASVNDLDWAPYSSTVICAVTEGDNSKGGFYEVYGSFDLLIRLSFTNNFRLKTVQRRTCTIFR